MRQPSPRIIKIVLIASMILMGACGLIYEYVLSVLGNYLMGTSHEEIFLIIGIMMFAMGLGSLLQRVIEGNLFEKFLVLEAILGLTGGFSASITYTAFALTPIYRVILYLFALTIGLMIGLEIPLLIRINRQYSQSLRVNLSEILAMDYVGSLLGALLFTYVLLTRFSLAEISFLLGLSNLTIALIGLIVFYTFLTHQRNVAILIVAGWVALSVGLYHAKDWSDWSEQKYYRDPIISRVTTPYQHLTLTQKRGPDGELNFFINGHLQFSSQDEFIYHELLVIPPMILGKRRERVLILGGGDGLALREVLKFPEVRHVDLVDLDPAVIDLATQEPSLVKLNRGAFFDARISPKTSSAIFPGEQVTVSTRNWRPEFKMDIREHPLAEVFLYLIDADRFVRDFDGIYDQIFIDLPDPSTLELAKLYSRDFYTLLRKHLDPEGFISVQSSSAYYTKDAFLCIGKTLEVSGFNVLPYHDNVPSFGEWGWHLAWRMDVTPETIFNQLSSIKEIPIETKYLTLPLLSSCFIFAKNGLTPRVSIEANSKMNPVLVQYYRFQNFF